MIPRSKSLPKHLDKLSSEIQDCPSHKAAILPRSRTAQTSLDSYFAAHPPWEAHEDPFNLSGFFPSRLTMIQTEWDWIKAEKPENEDNDDAVSYPEEDFEDLWSVHEGPEGSHDEMVRQVINGEDKYGMLAFSSEKIRKLLPKMPVLFDHLLLSTVPTSLGDDEPAGLDPEVLYARYCVRRQHSEERRRNATESPLGSLFLTRDGGTSGEDSLPNWVKVVSEWVGGAQAWL